MPLTFSANEGVLKCNACGNSFPVETVKALYDSEQKKTEFNWGDYKKNLDQSEKLENTNLYICRSCGAAIETDATTVATHCPYCDNVVVLSDKVEGGLRPNVIIPFKIDKKGLNDSINKYISGKKLLPNDFFDNRKISKIQGVYVPFWLFDAGLDGSMSMNATRIRHYSDSNYNYTETSHYLIEVDGEMRFEKVPVDGSIKMDDDLMDSIEPFNYSQLVDFDSAYLSGFLADRFDNDPDESLPRASNRMLNSAVKTVKSLVDKDYGSTSLRTNGMQIKGASVKYALLPVYLLNMEYNGKKYRFAVNGQTGKIVGELPISKAKKRKYFWSMLLPVAAIAFAVIYFFLR